MFKNQLKTFILLALLTSLLMWIGNYFGGYFGLVFAIIFVVIMNFSMFFFSDKIVLSMYKAKLTEKNSELYHLVDEVARTYKLPMPKVYIIPSKNPNAFATGRSPKHSSVAFTNGLLDLLKKHELKGVIAHELSHIKNRDTLVTTVAATIAGIISYVASMARWAAIFGGFGGRDRNNSNIFELLALAILTPLIATVLQLAISRSREFMADELAAKKTKDPCSLADALKKISENGKLHPMGMGLTTTSALFINNPFKGNGLFNLFSTHPPVEERIKRLKSIRIR